MTDPTIKRARIRPGDAADLNDYYQSSASALGFRSSHGSIVDLIANSAHLDSIGRSNGTEDAMARRLDSSTVKRHRAVRSALLSIPQDMQDTLFLTYGVYPSQVPATVRRSLGMVAGAALCTDTFCRRFPLSVTKQMTVAAAFLALELLCTGKDHVAVVEALQAEAEQVLGAAHAAYSEARDLQSPERLARRSVPARAAGGHAKAERIAVLLRDEAEAEASERSVRRAEARERLRGST